MEMSNEAQQILLKSVSKDCSHILEAIRRLRDGTWHLSDEDADWANFLFPQIRGALQDHIEYESLSILPGLSEDSRKEHIAEHEKIMALLWAVDHAKKVKNSESFHALLDLLVNTLDQHHQDFGCEHPRIADCQSDCATARIMKRALSSILENT